MSGPVRRLDHVAIAVEDTEAAIAHFGGRLGLAVVHTEELERPRVKLTYLDAGNAFIQLVEPLDPDSDVARFVAQNGEGIHHICFGVDDVMASAQGLSLDGETAVRGTGRGRISAFVPGPAAHGVRIECTEFDRDSDVTDTAGWLDGAPGLSR